MNKPRCFVNFALYSGGLIFSFLGIFGVGLQGWFWGRYFEVIYAATPLEIGLAYCLPTIAVLLGTLLIILGYAHSRVEQGRFKLIIRIAIVFAILMISLLGVSAYQGGRIAWSVRQEMLVKNPSITEPRSLNQIP